MATTLVEPLHQRRRRRTPASCFSTPKPPRSCFSYAAYAKNLIRHLRSSNIPVEPGLSEAEFSAVESSLKFAFPPDLRAILGEGLPVTPGFPHWRSASNQQLEILINLPVRGILKEVYRNGLWIGIWGDKPEDIDRAVELAEDCLKNASILVPVYSNFYIPATPCGAGNPVFYVRGADVRLSSFDIGGFFQRFEFEITGCEARSSGWFSSPAWVAKEERRIEFWSEIAEARVDTHVRRCLEEARGQLRAGGWKEEDILMMIDGCDRRDCNFGEPLDGKHVETDVAMLARRLLVAGWSREDVVEALGCSTGS